MSPWRRVQLAMLILEAAGALTFLGFAWKTSRQR
jgi:hypothetical protein